MSLLSTREDGTLGYLDASGAAGGGGFTNPMTTLDDLIVGGASGAPTRLAKGADSQVLTVDPVTHHLAWSTPTGGFASPMTTTGDMIYEGGGVDQVLGNASFNGSSGNGALATDGSDVTSFHPANGDNASWRAYDLGSAKTIAAWRIKQSSATATKVQTSADGSTGWTDQATYAGLDSGPTNFGSPVTARYWRFLLSGFYDIYTFSLFDAVVPTRLAKGAYGQMLVQGATAPAWAYDRPALDTYAMDATIGDEFAAAALDARWTRRSIVVGDEAYQQGRGASFMRVLPAARGVIGAGYLQPATADGEYAMKFIARNWPVCGFGLALVDSAGSGLVLQMYNGPFAYLLLDLTTYTTYGGSYTTAGFPAGVSVNQSVLPEDPGGAQIPVWLKVRKAGTSYYPAFSTDGEIWSPEGSARVWAGTMNRVGMLIGPLGSANGISSLGYVDIDWFNKIS
jgi:hypothetical protein